MVGEGEGGIGGPRRVAGGVFGLFRYGVPEAQVFEDVVYDGSIVDDRDDAQGVAALRALQWVDFVDLLNEPGPVRP